MIAPANVLLSRLAYPARKRMVKAIMTQAHLYNEDELVDCVCTLPYPDSFWHVLGDDVAFYLKHHKLWTDPEADCFHHLRQILLEDSSAKDVAYRFVRIVHPLTRTIPDMTYDNMFEVLRKPSSEVDAYVASILPGTEGYLEMKKAEYLKMMRSTSCTATVAEGMRLAETLLCTQYHPVVRQFVYWPASKALLVALLAQGLQRRNRILGFNDAGWVPEDYINLCRNPALMWETDEVCAYTETGARPGGDAHARDVSV
jgi:hypothetical protein